MLIPILILTIQLVASFKLQHQSLQSLYADNNGLKNWSSELAKKYSQVAAHV